jgi:hypothetical protein
LKKYHMPCTRVTVREAAVDSAVEVTVVAAVTVVAGSAAVDSAVEVTVVAAEAAAVGAGSAVAAQPQWL